jgi:hypothetical protein
MIIRDTSDPVRRHPARAGLAVLLLAMVAGLYACAPKITKVDAGFATPEGVVSPNARLIVWADLPTTAYVFGDRPPADPDSVADTLITSLIYERQTPRSLHGMIVDNTDADAFQMFRREPGGGLRQFANYTAARTAQWLGTQFEAYHFVDPAPSEYQPGTYICRGVVGGVVNTRSPLTNVATYVGAPIANIHVAAVWWNNTDPNKGPVFKDPPDIPPSQIDPARNIIPKIKLNWDQVPGAARYLLQVYEFRSDLSSIDERVLSGTPAPIYDGQAANVFVGYVPGDVNSMFVGDSSQVDVTAFVGRPMAYGSSLLVRLAALDANNHLIGLSLGDPNPQRAFLNGEMGLARGVFGLNTYMLFPYCATMVRTPAHAGGGGGGGG